MPSLNNSNDVKVTISTSADTKGLKDTQTALNQLSGETEDSSQKTDKLRGAFDSFGSTIKSVIVGIGLYKIAAEAANIVTSSIGDAIKRVDTLNNANRTFENMGFSAKDTSDMMNELKTSILGLPTSLNEAVSGVELLTGATDDIGKSRQIFTALNDGILGFGGSADQVNGAVIQLSQSLSNGKIDAQTWNSLIQSGLGPALNALAKTMGITTGALKDGLSDGTISVKKFEAALIDLDNNGGAGMASLQKIAHDSTSGIGTGMQNAKTAVVRGVADIINAIGSEKISSGIADIGSGFESLAKKGAIELPKVATDLGNIYTRLHDFLGPSFEALGNTLNDKVFPALNQLWKNIIEPLIPILGVTLVEAIKLTADTLNILFAAITPVINFMADHRVVVEALAAAFGALAASMALGAAFDAIKIGFATLQLITIPSMIASIGAASAAFAAAFPVAGILVDIGLVAKAIDTVLNTFHTLQTVKQGIAADNASIAAADAQMEALARNGTPAQQARAKSSLHSLGVPGYAVGTNNAPAGWSWVGERGPELMKLSGGEQIKDTQSSMHMSKTSQSGGMQNIFNVYNNADMDRAISVLSWRMQAK